MHAQLEDLYSLKLPLGRNLAGAVWKAETLKGGKPVAVAVLDLEDLSDPDLRKRMATRFRRDMGLLRRVNHPHVVRVFDVGRTREGLPFAAMEHVDGESLNDWLEEAHCGADRIRVASALLDGLQAAHRAGVAHGDLEPGNILMTSDEMPKLIGFGLNRTLARQSHPEWREESGLAKTIAFRAPEEARGMGGHSADLYAAGVLLHLICSGELPSSEGSTLRENAPRLPAGLVAVVERALVKDPAERHPNMNGMRRAWLAAAKVARDAIETATTGFRSETERRVSSLSAPPVGVVLSVEEPEEEPEEELDDADLGRPSLMPVGVALVGEDEEEDLDEEDLTSIPPERVNVMSSRPPSVGARTISKRFSDPPADPGMRISLSDVLDEDPPPDPEMRLSLSDAMEELPEPPKMAPRAVPRRPKPSPKPSSAPSSKPAQAVTAAKPEESSGSKVWIGLVAAVAIGGVVWFTQQPGADLPDEPVRTASPSETEVGTEPVAETEPVDTEHVETEPVAEDPPVEPEEAVVVALRLHGLPANAQVSVDGEAVVVEGDSIPFPGDGSEHAISVRAEGYETWERSLATATALDLLVVPEALAEAPTPPSMEAAPPRMEAATPMQVQTQTPRAEGTTTMSAPREQSVMATPMTTMRPGLARDPGF